MHRKGFISSCVFIIVLKCSIFSSVAQEDGLDSIKRAVEQYELRDTTRVMMLIELTKYYSTREINKNPELLQEALEISRELHYSDGIARSLSALSKHNVVIGQLEEALRNALQAKEIYDSLGSVNGLINVHNNLARIYNVKGEHQKSLELHIANVRLVKNRPASSEKAGMYFYVAKTYESLSQYDSAERYFLQALNISEESGFQTGISIAEGALGSVYNEKKEFNTAIPYLKKTLEFSMKYNHTTNIAAAYYGLAYSHQGLGNYEKSLGYINQSIQIYQNTDNHRMLKESYSLQTQLYESLNQYDRAFNSLKQFMIIKDTIFSENKTAIIEELQTKYETEQKEAKINSLSQAAEIQSLKFQQQQNLILGLVGLLAFLAVGGVLIYRQRKLKEEQRLTEIELDEMKKRLFLERQRRDSELKAIRSQMNPHFVFNALNSIQEYIMTNERKLAGKYLGKFADLMRVYLNHSQSKNVTLSEEVDTLNLYMELETLRFEDTLKYQIEVDESVDVNLEIPSFLLQPHVENAFKHGLLHKSGERRLEISFKQENDQLKCEVTDNGIGREKSAKLNKSRNHKSFATEANRNRLELLNQDRKTAIQETVEDVLNEHGECVGTKVNIMIPIEG